MSEWGDDVQAVDAVLSLGLEGDDFASAAAAQQLLEAMIRVPSITGDEAQVREVICCALRELGLEPGFVGRNIVVEIKRGEGPTLMLDSHMDTVPAGAGYTRDPYEPEVIDGKLYGLGSNDAGAPVVCMICAVAQLNRREDWQGTLKLAIVVEEEINGVNGTEYMMRQIEMPDAAIVGEPTGLDVCIAQKGLAIFNCENLGLTCHAANAYRLEHKNALLEAAEDALKVHQIEFAERDESLGPTTLNVTVMRSGQATNSIPDKATWNIDARVNPAQTLQGVLESVQAAVNAKVEPRRALRLHPMNTDPDATIVQAALKARQASKPFGSDTMSDAVFFRETNVIKVGPGVTEQSHKPDEWVALAWLPEGIAFYRDTALEYFRMMQESGE